MTDRDAAAEAILAARRAVRRLAPLPAGLRPASIAEGYAVQAALHRRLEADGARRAGWKIGCTNKVLQDLLGIHHPCAGAIMAADVHPSGAVLPWRAYVRPGIECEIAFELGEDVPASGAPWTRETVLARVATVMPAIEVVDDRYTGYAEVGTPTLIADDFFQAAAVLGPRSTHFRTLDLAAIAAETVIDDSPTGVGTGAAVMGNPAEPLAWLANTLAEHGSGLKRGDIVLTGSMVNVRWLDRPGTARVDNSALGSVTVRFVETAATS